MRRNHTAPPGLATAAVHGTQSPGAGRVMIPPMVLDAAMSIDDVDQGIELLSLETAEGFFYSRYGNPTVRLLEERIAALEGAESSASCCSGMTAVWLTIIALCSAGDHVLLPFNVYHEITDSLTYLERHGISVSGVNMADLGAVVASLTDRTSLILLESPTNPMLQVVDIAMFAKLAHERNIVLAVDNTMPTFLQQPALRLGADLTLYSTTKHINGHGDAIGGIICGREDLIAKIREVRDLSGTIITPFNAWLTLRGLKTLPLRLEQQTRNAAEVAAWLESHECVSRVLYPGLESHPDHELACRQMTGPGSIVTFEIAGGKQAGTRFLRRLQLCRIATTFGNLETIVYHFATFARPSRDISAIGETEATVRCSLGLEDVADVMEDLDQALRGA